VEAGQGDRKRLGSRYVSGRTRDWVKMKNPKAQPSVALRPWAGAKQLRERASSCATRRISHLSSTTMSSSTAAVCGQPIMSRHDATVGWVIRLHAVFPPVPISVDAGTLINSTVCIKRLWPQGGSDECGTHSDAPNRRPVLDGIEQARLVHEQACHQDRRNAFPVFNFIQNSSGHRRRLPLIRAGYTGPIEASAPPRASRHRSLSVRLPSCARRMHEGAREQPHAAAHRIADRAAP
jgi:hypothetical protein